MCTICSVKAQQFVATQNGNWNVGTTWGGVCTSGCIAGIDYPGASNDAFTNGFQITVAGNQSCRDLFVEDVAGSLIFPGQITVNGVMIGWSGGQFGIPAFGGLINNVFSGTSVFTFTATDLSNFGNFNTFNNEIIAFWNNNSPIGVARFQLSNPGVIDSDFSLASIRFTNQFIHLSGALSTGPSLSAIEIGSSFIVNAPFTSLVPIYGITGVSSLIATTQINNSLVMSSSGAYLNTNTFIMSAPGSLTTSFSGGSQSEGWWLDSNSPTTLNINSSATINYNANTSQNIFSTTYGNLIVEASSTVTKTLVGGNLTISGGLTVNGTNTTFDTDNNQVTIGGDLVDNGIWAPNGLVDFNGSGNQTINGSSPTVFNGGIRISNMSGIVSMSNIGADVNGTFDIDPSASFDPVDQTINVSSNMTIDGAINASDGTFIFDGTTTISSVNTNSKNFNDVQITGILNAPIPSDGSMNISGDFTNDGSFNSNGSLLVFNGSDIGGQSISGSQSISFTDMEVSNPQTVFLDGTANLNGTLTLSENGIFDVDGELNTGTFTIESNSVTSSARIAEIPSGASVVGSLIMERFVTGVSGGDFRYLSFPISGPPSSLFLDQWSDNFPITGASYSNPDPAGSNNVVDENATSVFFYNEINDAFEEVAGATVEVAPLEPGRGYSVFTYLDGTHTIDMNGEIIQGAYTNTNISNTGSGFNLVGNPYPSSISGNLLLDDASNSGFDNTFHIRSANVSGTTFFASYNTETNSVAGTVDEHPNGTSWDGTIAMGQAFWLQSTGAAELSFTESMKVEPNTSLDGSFLNDSRGKDFISIRLESNDEQVDVAVIALRDYATDTFDIGFDAIKFRNGNFDANLGFRNHINLSSFSANPEDNLVFNFVSSTSCEQNINLRMEDTPVGEYSLSFLDMDSFSSPFNLVLIDNFTGTSHNISNYFVYEFEITEDELSTGDDRFDVQFSSLANIPTIELSNTSFSGCVGNSFNIEALSNDAENEIRVYGSFDSDTPLFTSDQGLIEISNVVKDSSIFISSFNPSTCESERLRVSIGITELLEPQIEYVNGTLISSSIENNQWFLDGEIINGSTNDSLSIRESGDYSVRVEQNGCSMDSDVISIIISSNKNLTDDENSILIFPNPVDNNVINILCSNPIEHIEIKSLEGKVLFSSNYINDKTLKEEILTSNIKSGVYILIVHDEEGNIYTERIVLK